MLCCYVGRRFTVVAVEVGERPRLLPDDTEPAGAVGVELPAPAVVAGPEFVMDARRSVYLVVTTLVLRVINNVGLWTTGSKKLVCRLLDSGSVAETRLLRLERGQEASNHHPLQIDERRLLVVGRLPERVRVVIRRAGVEILEQRLDGLGE